MKTFFLASSFLLFTAGCEPESDPQPSWPYEREEQREDRNELDRQQLIDEREREVNYQRNSLDEEE